MKTDRHLILQNTVLSPAAEWSPPMQGWVVARVAEGVGYWMHSGQVRELKEGDGLVVAGKRGMVVRASQLGILRLEFYLLQPPLLNGLLTVTEENKLELVAAQLKVPVLFFTAADALGQKFSRLVHQTQPESLPARAALVQLWSQAVDVLLTRPLQDESERKLKRRFLQLLARMPDAELAQMSLTQLAGMLSCSERHFRRLFLQEFGVSLRTRQIESRLQRARQLLHETEDKISNIAFESGYRHLGLFNVMFKKRFGLTPSAWRQRKQNVSSASINSRMDAGSGLVPDNSRGNRCDFVAEFKI